MKDFLKSNTFYMIISIVIAILLWIYVVYDVRPTYEMTVEDVPVSCINASELFSSGSIAIVGENENLLTEGVYVDVKIKGKRSAVSAVRPGDINCTLDLITVNKAGSYSIKPSLDISRNGVDIVYSSPGNIKFKVESIEQKDIDIELKTTGSLPKDYEIIDRECKNTSVKITGPKSAISKVSSARVLFDYSSLDVNDTEKSLEIMFFDADNKLVDVSDISKSVGYAKVSFSLRTTKEVTVKLVPRYLDDVRKNYAGNSVSLAATQKGVAYEDGVELKVKLKGTAAALEKYVDSVCTVYTEPIDVKNIYSDQNFEKIEAAPLTGDIEYVQTPVVGVRATVKF